MYRLPFIIIPINKYVAHMIDEKNQHFSLKKKDVLWSVKYFIYAICTAFIISILMYSVMLLVSEPAHVDEAIITTASAAVAKVKVTSEYINPMWAIFLFNSIAAFGVIISVKLN